MKMNKKKTIIIVAGVLLVLIALIVIIFACANNDEKVPETSAPETTEEATLIELPAIEDDETTTLPAGKLPPNAGNQPEEIEIYTNPVSTSNNPEITTKEFVTHKAPK
jgi:flagellar basal body-associated protein FliL